MVRSETRYFNSRVQARNGLRAQLRERIEQHAEQIEGLSLQAKAQEESLGLVADELEGLEQLYAQKLITQNRVMVLRREAATMRGSLGQLLAEIAATKGQVSETELQIIQIDQDLRSEVNKELRETAEKIAELGRGGSPRSTSLSASTSGRRTTASFTNWPCTRSEASSPPGIP